jgi:hypothetical protein
MFTLVMAGFSLTGLFAQEAIPAVGGDASGAGGSVSYTVGQTLYETHSGSTGSVAQGVQQPFEILELPGVGSPMGISLHCVVFPNPVTEFVLLRIADQSLEGLSYQLYNLQGKMLERREITGDITEIPMSSLGAATYLIKVTRKNEELKAFKIIKK